MTTAQADFFNYLLAIFIGIISAFAELLSRYKKFKSLFTNGAALLYLMINAVAAGLAFYFIKEFDLVKNVIWRVVLAGTSSLIILRSSFANIKVGDKNVEAGIGAIMQVFLSYADRRFDQERSTTELEEIKRIMKEVDFEKAKISLPIICFSIMKNLSLQEQDKISGEVKKISESLVDNLTKALGLGIILADVTDTKLLEKAVKVLDQSISETSTVTSPLEQLTRMISGLQNTRDNN